MTTVSGVTLHGFRLSETGLVPVGRPTFDQWQLLGETLMWMESSVHWWIVDWVEYGEGHFGERFSQALDVTGWREKTLQQYLWVGRNVPTENRGRLPIGHYIALAPLEPAQQQRWIAWCEEEQDRTGELPSQRDLRHTIRCSGRAPTATATAELTGTYPVVYADPPWAYRDNRDTTDGGSFSRADRHYPTMSIEAIAELQ